MTQLAGWVLLCGGVAWLLRRRPISGVCLAIALWSVVPSIAGHRITGTTSGLGFHPATYLLGCILLVQLVLHPGPLAAAVNRHVHAFWAIAVFVVGAGITSVLTESGGLRLLMDQIVGPGVLFWLVIAYAYEDRRLLLLLRNSILAVVAAQCLLALVQWWQHDILFWSADHLTRSWFLPERGFDRWFGTADSPLVLSLTISVAAALTLGLRRASLRFVLLTLFVVGSVITQSRTGTALTTLIVLSSIVRSHAALWKQLLSMAALGTAGYLIASSVLVSGIAGRLVNDTGSTNARLRAGDFVLSHWTEFWATGYGLTSSYTIGRVGGLRTSLESAYLMYAVDTGFLLASVYFGLQLALLLRHGWQLGVPGATLATVVGCLLQHTFSGTAGSNASGTIIWATLALVVAGSSVVDGADGERLETDDHETDVPAEPPQPAPAAANRRTSSVW